MLALTGPSLAARLAVDNDGFCGCGLQDTGFQPDTQGIEPTQHEPEFGAAVPSFNADDPLATDFDALGQGRLAKAEFLVGARPNGTLGLSPAKRGKERAISRQGMAGILVFGTPVPSPAMNTAVS